MRCALAASIAVACLFSPPAAVAQIPIAASQDIGAVAAPGYFSQDGGAVTVAGSGADIWKSADEFHYAYAMLSGDGEIVARVLSLTNTDPWAKAGPMIRESLSPGSRFAMMIITPAAQGAAFQYRVSTGGLAAPSSSGDLTSTIPRWLRLVRQGNSIAGYHSVDGINWTFRSSINIALPPTVYVGLAVTGHNDGVVAAARFDEVHIIGPQADRDPPDTPQNLSAAASGSSRIDLQWTSSTDTGGSGIKGYRVYRNYATDPLATVTGATYRDSGLEPDTDYTYEVSALDFAGNASARTEPASARTASAALAGSPPDWFWSIEPGTWHAIGENTMDSVNSERDLLLNPRFPSNAPWHGSIGLRGTIDAWNSGAFATGYGTHGSLLVYGGGRNNYLGSDVYAFDLGTQRWHRVTNPYPGPFSWPFPSTSYPDGSPVPPHTYDYIDYHPGSNSFVLLRGIADGKAATNDTSVAIAHFLNLDSGVWRTGVKNGAAAQKSGGISCYDENRDLFWTIAPSDRLFSSFDPNVENLDGTFGRYTNYVAPLIYIDGGADCDPERDIFVYTQFSTTQGIYARDLKSPSRQAVLLKESGTPPALKESKHGWVWSKRRAAFIYWRRGGDVYEFRLVAGNWDTGTWQWSRLTDESNVVIPQSMVTDNGVYGRFRIARYGNDEVGIVVNQITGSVYAFRIP